jgi:hypothetical protein
MCTRLSRHSSLRFFPTTILATCVIGTDSLALFTSGSHWAHATQFVHAPQPGDIIMDEVPVAQVGDVPVIGCGFLTNEWASVSGFYEGVFLLIYSETFQC